MEGKAEEGCSNHSPRYRILFICVPAVLYLNLLIGRMYLRIMVHGIHLSGTELSWGSPEY